MRPVVVALVLAVCVATGSILTLFAQQQQDSDPLDDLAFPTWVAFQELEVTVRLIIQTSPPAQKRQMLRILENTIESDQVPEDHRERAAGIRARLTPLLER